METSKTPTKDTKATLLERAGQLFLARGFENVSVRQITEASGANVAAVNYHFGGKTNIYREALALRLDEITRDKLSLLKGLAEQRPAVGLEQLLDRYIRSYFESFLASPDHDRLLQMIYREMGPDAVAGDLVASRLVRPLHQAFQEALLACRPNLRASHASLCVSSIMGQVIHFIRARVVLGSLHSPDQNQTYIEDAVSHITQFSLRGIGSNHHV